MIAYIAKGGIMQGDKNGIENAKKRVSLLAGRNILIKVNKGRNKFIQFDGVIENVYPSIFTIKASIDDEDKIMSYSYNDILTKVVRFYPSESEKNILA